MNKARSKTKRIAVDATAAWTGGGASRVRELAATFDALAPQYEYVFAISDRVRRELHRTPPSTTVIEVPRLARAAPARATWELVRLPRILRGMSVDWVLAPFNVLPLSGLDDQVSKAVILSSILPLTPGMWRHLSLYQQARVRTLRRLTLRSIRAATHVFLLSSEGWQLVADEVGGEKMTLLPMAPPHPEVLARARHLPVDVPQRDVFLVVADLLPYKGIEDAIRATRELNRRGRRVSLFICGNPVYRPYADQMRSLAREVGGNVIFLGGLSHERVLALMAKATGTLVCTRFENTSRVPVEAMAIGSPLIYADTQNAREVCGDAALYYPPGSHTFLADLMERFIDDETIRRELRARGSRHIGDRDWLSATRLILQVINGERN